MTLCWWLIQPPIRRSCLVEGGLNLSVCGRAWRGDGWCSVHTRLWLSPVALAQLEVLRPRRVPSSLSRACSILDDKASSQLGFPHSLLPSPHRLLGSAVYPWWLPGDAHLCVPGAYPVNMLLEMVVERLATRQPSWNQEPCHHPGPESIHSVGPGDHC